MPGKKTNKFTLRDYVSLSVALSLALAVWLIHNLSQKYSQVVQCDVVAVSNLDARASVADKSAKLAARCEMSGWKLLYYKIFPDSQVTVKFDRHELVYLGTTRYYVLSSDLFSHSHEIFGDKAKCEYFVTDTLFFDFQAVDYKKVPVNLVSNIEFEPQHMAVGQISIVPDSVFVYGPMEQLERTQYISTRPLFLDRLNSDSAGELQLESPQGMRLGVNVVEYHILVTRYIEETISAPVEMVGVPKGKEIIISPSIAQVTVRSVFPKEQSDDNQIKVVIDYKDFENSVSGRCIGQVRNLSKSVLSSHLTPEIFDCVENTAEQ